MGQWIVLILKGMAMGAANVIPGVSGGTIALVAGIYRRLIDAMGRINASAFKLFLSREWKTFWKHIDGTFLTLLFVGVCAGILSLARVLKFCLEEYPQWTYALFFGLILASVYFVAKAIKSYNAGVLIAFVVGVAVAVSVALITPGSENATPVYLLLCGAIAVCSMILPGLSGSFVLILMGNYALVLGSINAFTDVAKSVLQGDIDAVVHFFGDQSFQVLLFVGIGVLVGLLLFSRLLSWVYARYENATLGLLTGFVAGSLLIIWPWKKIISESVSITDEKTKEVVVGYEWLWPDLSSAENWGMIGLMVVGAVALILLEKLADAGENEAN